MLQYELVLSEPNGASFLASASARFMKFVVGQNRTEEKDSGSQV